MWDLYHRAMRVADGFDRQEWFYVLLGVVVIGLICMRGFGSRSKY